MSDPTPVYGYCPECGVPGLTRERRPNGYDHCENGHKYLSANALKEKPAQPWRRPLGVNRASADPTLDPKTRALVDALLEAVEQPLNDDSAVVLANAADALRDHLRPKPLTVEEYAEKWDDNAVDFDTQADYLAAFYRDLKAAIARGEVVDDEG